MMAIDGLKTGAQGSARWKRALNVRKERLANVNPFVGMASGEEMNGATLWKDVETIVDLNQTIYAKLTRTSALPYVVHPDLVGSSFVSTEIERTGMGATETAESKRGSNVTRSLAPLYVGTVEFEARNSVIRLKGALKIVNHFLDMSATRGSIVASSRRPSSVGMAYWSLTILRSAMTAQFSLGTGAQRTAKWKQGGSVLTICAPSFVETAESILAKNAMIQI